MTRAFLTLVLMVGAFLGTVQAANAQGFNDCPEFGSALQTSFMLANSAYKSELKTQLRRGTAANQVTRYARIRANMVFWATIRTQSRAIVDRSVDPNLFPPLFRMTTAPTDAELSKFYQSAVSVCGFTTRGDYPNMQLNLSR